MRFKLLKLRLRRRVHLEEKRAEDFSQQAAVGIEHYFFRRLGRLHKVRRRVFIWLTILVIAIVATGGQAYLLGDYYQTLKPVAGGIYNEGVLGTFTTANPIYAVSDIDTTLSNLIFAPLFNYNQQNQLVGALASSYSVNSAGNQYTVHLKPNLTWQDGRPITSSDVAFTYNLIEDPNAESPLFNSWQNIKVSTDGPQVIVFNLPDPLASFPEDLTNGILPEHLLASIPADEMRSAPFNFNNPIGSGPFQWQDINVSGNDPTNAVEQIELRPFNNYEGGQAKLQGFVVHGYANQQELINAFNSGQLNGAEGLQQVPPDVRKNKQDIIHNFILTAGVYTFFKTTSGVLADQSVRTSLLESANISNILAKLGYPTVAVNEPLLQGQLAYNPQYTQASYNLSAAEANLSQDGWAIKSDGFRYKNGQQLGFNLTLPNNQEYIKDAVELKKDWRILGAKVVLSPVPTADFSNILQTHTYDAILYGISIGVDPDVFVYWDSSQAQANSSNRLNLSEWQDPAADESLQEGRTRIDPPLRVIDYENFLSEWQKDSPALGLYQPRLLYITHGRVFGISSGTINSNTDRFKNVVNWEIDESRVTD